MCIIYLYNPHIMPNLYYKRYIGHTTYEICLPIHIFTCNWSRPSEASKRFWFHHYLINEC